MQLSPRLDFRPWSRDDSMTNRTAVYGPVRTVVWEGRRSDPSPYPDVCWACPAAWKCKSSTQPDGGEGLAIRNGVVREAGSERSVEQKRESMNKNRI